MPSIVKMLSRCVPNATKLIFVQIDVEYFQENIVRERVDSHRLRELACDA